MSIVAYLQNKDSKMIYKALNNKVLFLWLRSKKEWVKSATQYQDLFIGDYLECFDLIPDHKIEEYL